MPHRWQFADFLAVPPTTATFFLNPAEGGSPSHRKSMVYQSTAAPDGKLIAFEGRDEAMVSEVTGTILEQAHLEFFKTWFKKRRQIRLTDDLGRVFTIYITGFAPARQRAATRPYKHSYTLSYLILEDGV